MDYWLTSDLRAQGVSWQRITKAVAEGRIIRIVKGLYVRPDIGVRQFMEALARRFPKLVFAGDTAGYLYGMGNGAFPVQAVVPRGHRGFRSRWMEVRESRSAAHFRTVGNLKVVSPAAAVNRAKKIKPWKQIELLERCYQGKDGKAEFAEDLRALGRASKNWVRDRGKAAVIGASSNNERRLAKALRQEGIETEPNYIVAGYAFDLKVKGRKVLIEIDSIKYHDPNHGGPDREWDNQRQFIIDRWKGNAATRMGYQLLRFSEECVNVEQFTVVSEVRRVVDKQKGALAPPWKWHRSPLFDG